MNDAIKPYSIIINGVAAYTTDAVIVVPQDATEDPARIRLHCDAFDSSGKHTLFSLSQIALLDFEDGLIEPIQIAPGEPLGFDVGQGRQTIDAGLIVFRAGNGGAAIVALNAENIKRLLKETLRYCTRFIRLDVH